MRIKAIINKNDVRQKEYIEFLELKFPQILTEENPELFYVIGGDGAMHHAHKENQDAKIPFFGKGLGTLNFIMNNFDNDEEVITKLLNDEIDLSIVKTNKVSVTIADKYGEVLLKSKCINDMVIGHGIMDYHNFIINSERGTFDNLDFKGMGFCLSTPLGSTAFNINNYGKVLPLDSGMWSITSIVGDHRVNEVMMPQTLTIKIKDGRVKPNLYVDGTATTILLEFGDTITFKPSKETFKIAFLDAKEFHNKRMKLIQAKR